MIATLANLKAQLNVTSDLDDTLLTRKLAAAQNYVESWLGYKIETEYPPTDGEPPVSTVPPALVEAVLQLAAHWYENREATLVGVTAQDLSHGVSDVIREYRRWWSKPDGE
ncbi:MAG: head-tail connector protein [Xanthobacteraceae bacterium]|nr:head-tail connector protein [Xanthobacteraceae bacterium]